jgi:hypothetical protein
MHAVISDRSRTHERHALQTLLDIYAHTYLYTYIRAYIHVYNTDTRMLAYINPGAFVCIRKYKCMLSSYRPL